MSDIQTYLRQILDAVYGEEVRNSIHDAISTMNSDLESAIQDDLNPLAFKGNLGESGGTNNNLNNLVQTDQRGIWRLLGSRTYTNVPSDFDNEKQGYLVMYAFGTAGQTANVIKQEIHYFSDNGANANVSWSRIYLSSAWLPWHKNVDDTLLINGAAADSKSVGKLRDALASITGYDVVNVGQWIYGEYILNTDGSVGTSTSYKRTDYIEIFPEVGNLKVTSIGTADWDNKYNAWYDADHTFISSFSYPKGDGSRVYTTPANAKYIRMSCNKAVTLYVEMDYFSIADSIKATRTADAQSIFNVVKDTVSSFTVPENFENGGFNSDGTNSEDESMKLIRLRTKGFIPVKPNTVYTFGIHEYMPFSFSVSFYDTNDYAKSRIEATNWTSLRNRDFRFFTTPNNANYIRILIRYNSDESITVDSLSASKIYLYETSTGLTVNGVPWSNGGLYATTGDLNKDAANLIYSFPLNDGHVILRSYAVCKILLFKDGLYYGKINSEGTVDKLSGNWKDFKDSININSILQQYSADSLTLSLSSSDPNKPINASNYEAWAMESVLITHGSALSNYIYDSVKLLSDSDVRMSFNIAKDIAPSLITSSDFENGGFSVNGINTTENSAYRLRSKGFIPVEAGKTYVIGVYEASPYSISVSFYQDNNYTNPRISSTDWMNTGLRDYLFVTIPSGIEYIRILIKSRSDSTIDANDLKSYDVYLYDSSYAIEERGVKWSNGGIFATNGGANRDATNQVYSPFLTEGIVLMREYAFGFVAVFSNGSYLGKINSSGALDKVSGNWKRFQSSIDIDEILSTYNGDCVIICASTDDTDDPLTASNYKEWSKNNLIVTHDRGLIDYFNPSRNYVINSDLIRRPVKVFKQYKYIAGYQSCCKYGNNYYSTDGSKLYVQDSDFNTTNTVDLNLGHGNGLQLGSSNIAYSSGWDDGKVYCVNLDTLQIADTIDLPVSGYTTCAVDDLNSIIYIFYRSSYPDTYTNYEFIVYDYANENIISRRIINSFRAMQACDLYNGKLVVAYGMMEGDAGIFVYNTNGDILADYKLRVMENLEPEGVFVDRGSGQLYFTMLDKAVYTIKN